MDHHGHLVILRKHKGHFDSFYSVSSFDLNIACNEVISSRTQRKVDIKRHKSLTFIFETQSLWLLA